MPGLDNQCLVCVQDEFEHFEAHRLRLLWAPHFQPVLQYKPIGNMIIIQYNFINLIAPNVEVGDYWIFECSNTILCIIKSKFATIFK